MSDYEIFLRNYVPPKTYMEILDTTFGRDWREWEPETLLQEIFRTFSVRPPSLVQDKIFALQTFLNTGLFWDNALVFENMILAFGDRFIDPDLIQGAIPEELAYGMTVAGQLGKTGKPVQDIIEYIRASHRDAGVLVYHPALKFAQPEYTDEFRKSVAEKVAKKLASGEAPPEDIDHEDPVQVQWAKSRDVHAYVQERIERGE